MKIGELARKTEVSRDTIRFYEKQGILTNITRPFEWNNYKYYDEENVKRISVVKCLKKFGFTLNECKGVLERMDSSPTGGIDRNTVLGPKLNEINRQINQLKQTRDTLINILEK